MLSTRRLRYLRGRKRTAASWRNANAAICAVRAMNNPLRLRRHSNRLPTGELTGYIGITEAKLPKEFHLSSVVHISQEDCLGSSPAQSRGFLYSNRRGSELAHLVLIRLDYARWEQACSRKHSWAWLQYGLPHRQWRLRTGEARDFQRSLRRV